jgi:hypothetical protein
VKITISPTRPIEPICIPITINRVPKISNGLSAKGIDIIIFIILKYKHIKNPIANIKNDIKPKKRNGFFVNFVTKNTVNISSNLLIYIPLPPTRKPLPF